VCLVKPQFEAGRDQVGSGGVVRDEGVRRTVIDRTVAALVELGLDLVGVVPSPIRGPKGNLEELAVFRMGQKSGKRKAESGNPLPARSASGHGI
jgi:23S rRNA (cytidine1920-2'-O)/16S rRNA (cytidine1409-2'-O)-methyltransferase